MDTTSPQKSYDASATDIRLIALDLDGTLLDSQKRLSAENSAALSRAAAAGIEIVPTTGRFYEGIPEEVRNLPFVRYAITMNGAQVFDARERCVLQRAEIANEAALAVMEYLDALPVVYDCYMDDGGWMSRRFLSQMPTLITNAPMLAMIQRTRTPVEDLMQFVRARGTSVQKVQAFFADMTLRRRVMEEFPARFPTLVCSSSIPNNIEINDRLATKGRALRWLSAHCGVPMSAVAAFGDGVNDVSMIEAAGFGVAMGNACPEVLAAAQCVTTSCDENGVAQWLACFV